MSEPSYSAFSTYDVLNCYCDHNSYHRINTQQTDETQESSVPRLRVVRARPKNAYCRLYQDLEDSEYSPGLPVRWARAFVGVSYFGLDRQYGMQSLRNDSIRIVCTAQRKCGAGFRSSWLAKLVRVLACRNQLRRLCRFPGPWRRRSPLEVLSCLHPAIA